MISSQDGLPAQTKRAVFMIFIIIINIVWKGFSACFVRPRSQIASQRPNPADSRHSARYGLGENFTKFNLHEAAVCSLTRNEYNQAWR